MSMQRRILAAIVTLTSLAVVLFGLPLALAVEHLYRSEAVLRLEREATVATTAVPASFATANDPVELPDAGDQTQLGLYGTDGRRVSGSGPDRLDATGRTALGGHVAEQRTGPTIVVAVPVASAEQVVGVVRAAQPEAVVAGRARRAWGLMLALAAGAILVAALIGRWQAARLHRPVGALAAVAARLGEGDFSARAGRSGVTELDAVAATLNATAERLGRLLARERAFSADASHQLRTPLAGLRLRLEAAIADPHTSRDQAIADALAEVDRLEATVEELLALARDIGPAREPLDVTALLDELEQAWRGPLAAGGRPLRIVAEQPLPHVRASAAAVRQILAVLASNAVQHGAGMVTVCARGAAGGLAIEVSDEGPGVAGDPERAFARRSGSEPGSGSPPAGNGGHGIGLALARSLAEAEGGRLLLSRTGPAPVFTLLLPATRP
jgi:signal transduction histidine kinase